jgi:hypothetical protein
MSRKRQSTRGPPPCCTASPHQPVSARAEAGTGYARTNHASCITIRARHALDAAAAGDWVFGPEEAVDGLDLGEQLPPRERIGEERGERGRKTEEKIERERVSGDLRARRLGRAAPNSVRGTVGALQLAQVNAEGNRVVFACTRVHDVICVCWLALKSHVVARSSLALSRFLSRHHCHFRLFLFFNPRTSIKLIRFVKEGQK